MVRGKRLLSLLLVCVLFFSLALQCQASEINKTREKGEKLKEQKKEAEQMKNDLAKELDELLGEMEQLEKEISEKEEELFAKEEELMSAQVEENNQYESMKKRIKYMYENKINNVKENAELTQCYAVAEYFEAASLYKAYASNGNTDKAQKYLDVMAKAYSEMGDVSYLAEDIDARLGITDLLK